jgi:hypothetical protein
MFSLYGFQCLRFMYTLITFGSSFKPYLVPHYCLCNRCSRLPPAAPPVPWASSPLPHAATTALYRGSEAALPRLRASSTMTPRPAVSAVCYHHSCALPAVVGASPPWGRRIEDDIMFYPQMLESCLIKCWNNHWKMLNVEKKLYISKCWFIF